MKRKSYKGRKRGGRKGNKRLTGYRVSRGGTRL